MARNRVANMNDFKAPHEQVAGAAGSGGANNAGANANNFGPTQPKKRRKTAANANVTQTPTTQDLLPPPPTSTFGDTIVASNPFDDTPTVSVSSVPNSMHNGMMNSHMAPVMGMHMNGPPHMHHPNSPLHQHLSHGPPPSHLPPSHMNHPHGMPPHPGNHHQPHHPMHSVHPMHPNQTPSPHMHPGMIGPGANMSGNGSPLRSMHQMNNTFGLGHPMSPDGIGMPPHVNNMNNRMPPTQMPGMIAMPGGGGGQMNPNMNPNMSSMNPLGQLAQMGVGPNAHLGMNSPNGTRMNSSSPNMAMNSPNIGPNGNRIGSASPHLGMNSPNIGANGTRLGNSPLSTISNISASPMGSPILQNAPNGGMPPLKNNGPMGPPPMNGNNAMPPGMPMMPGQAGPRMNLANGSPINPQMMPMSPHQQQQQQQQRNGMERFGTERNGYDSLSLSSHSRSSLSPLSSLSSLSSMVGGTGPVPNQGGVGGVGHQQPPHGNYMQETATCMQDTKAGGGLTCHSACHSELTCQTPWHLKNSMVPDMLMRNDMRNDMSSMQQQPPHMQQHPQYPPSHLMQQQMSNMPPSMQQRALQQPPTGPMQQKGMPPIGVVSPFTNSGHMPGGPHQGPPLMDNNNPLNSLNAMSGAPLPQSSPCIPNNNQMSQMPPNGLKPITNSSEKIYPADKSIVFNPQNPNAPPIYACGMCHKEINDNDEAVFCDLGCKFFYHR